MVQEERTMKIIMPLGELKAQVYSFSRILSGEGIARQFNTI
jgi:hypothetical protein